jgi:hypothetical protein
MHKLALAPLNLERNVSVRAFKLATPGRRSRRSTVRTHGWHTRSSRWDHD